MRWACAVCVIAACGGARRDAEPPAPVSPDAAPSLAFDDEAARQLADGFLEVLGAMAEAIEARVAICEVPTSGACEVDCASMAADLDAIFDISAPLFELAATVQDDDAAAKRAVAAMKAHGDAAKALEDRISSGLAWCRGSAEVFEVIGRMPVL